MAEMFPYQGLIFAGPATYHIRIQSFLDATWSERCGNDLCECNHSVSVKEKESQ